MPIIDPTKEVKILTKNCVDSATTIVSDHGGTTSYLYDRDTSTLWKSSGADRDAIPSVLTFTFNVNGTETQFTINTLILLNTNARAIDFEWWNATTSLWVPIVGWTLDADYGCFTFGAVLTSRVRLTLKNTQHPNHEKQLGQIIVARVRHVFSMGFSMYNVAFRNKQSQIELGDGSLAMAYTRPLGARIDRYAAQCVFSYLPRTDYDFLYCLKNEGEPFIFWPESVSRPTELWFVHWVNPFMASYMTAYVGNGYSLTMELQEV